MDLNSITEEIYNSSAPEEKVTEHARNISTRITTKEIRLVDIIEALGPKLTSVEVQDRTKAMDFISQLFTFLKSDFLTEKELTFIVDFLHDRLKDQHVVIAKVFLCILPIVRCKNLPNGSTAKLLNQLFREGNIQSHTQKHRRAVFQTFQYCLQNRLEELKKLCSTDFVMNFLQAMDGEKDPRNLLILFHCIPIILTYFPLEPFVEDFFEVLSCYFPIDFKPSVAVPGGEIITREDLVQPLHMCLSQTNIFCKLLVPLLMEKLDSSVIDAKLDSLDLLGMCCERSYTAEDINPFLATIWHALRREIFMGGNELVETACINYLRLAFRLLSRNANVLQSCISMIFGECKHHLSEPELRLSQPTARILTALAEGSQESCRSVLRLTIPLLYEQFSIKPMSSVRKGLLAIMITLTSTLRLYPSVKLTTALPNWDEVLALWFTLLTHSDPDFTLLALEFFARLLNNSLRTTQSEFNASFSEHISEKENISSKSDSDDLDQKNRTLLQEHLLSMLMKINLPADVRSSVISTMSEVARSFSEEFVETSVPRLLLAISTQTDEMNKQHSLNSLAECSAYPIVAKSVIPGLLNREIEDASIVLCLASIIEKGCENNINEEAAMEFTNFFCLDLHSLDIFVRASINSYKQEADSTYLILGRIVRILVRSAGESIQQELINSFWNDRVISEDCGKMLTEIPILLVESFLGSVRPTVEILKKNQLLRVLLDIITTTSIKQSNGIVSNEMEKKSHSDEIVAIRLYSTLLNKSKDPDFKILLTEVETVLERQFNWNAIVKDESENRVRGHSKELIPDVNKSDATVDINTNGCSDTSFEKNVDTAAYKHIIVFLTTLVKALAMRGITDLDKWIDKMVDLLDNPVYGCIMSNEFSSLMTDCSYSLNSKSFCNFRFLYKQRIFLVSVPKLVAAYGRISRNCGGTRSNYMRALSSQLKYVSGPVLHLHIDKVFPLLVASLSIECEMNEESNVEILLSSLIALRDFFKLQSEQSTLATEGRERTTLIEYFHDIAPRLVILAQFKPNMEVRILALKCLQCCAKLPTHVVLPLKPSVTSSLKAALDDPKRLVRKEAVITRNIWILVGAPGGF